MNSAFQVLRDFFADARPLKDEEWSALSRDEQDELAELAALELSSLRQRLELRLLARRITTIDQNQLILELFDHASTPVGRLRLANSMPIPEIVQRLNGYLQINRIPFSTENHS